MNNEDFILTTPVVFEIFNRPDFTMRVFERIRRARPPKLFIIADGPRASRGGFEIEACRACRSVKDMVDWDCEVFTNFSDVNMGCGKRISTGITWVFEHVDEAIILEDDCLPSMSFFRFCQELLEKYRNDNRVMVISGCNHDVVEDFDESYAFAKNLHMWGWATWKRAWDLCDMDMKLWSKFREGGYLKNLFPHHRYIDKTNELQYVHDTGGNTWDHQFGFCTFINHGLDVIPKVNMVKNLGCNDSRGANWNPRNINVIDRHGFYMDEDIQFPLVHPQIMSPLDRSPEPYPRPSIEEANAELNRYNARFQQLINSRQYKEMLVLFKDTLRNSKIFNLNYVFYAAYAYLMLEDFDHAVDLCNDILRLGRVQADALTIFVKTLVQNDRAGDALTILQTALQKKCPMSEHFAKDIKMLIQSQNCGEYPEVAALIAE